MQDITGSVDLDLDSTNKGGNLNTSSDSLYCKHKESSVSNDSMLDLKSQLNGVPTLRLSSLKHSGVLFKRRDVFLNEWRPRYFVLDHNTGLLSYYLIDIPEKPQCIYRHHEDDGDAVHSLVPVEERGAMYVPHCVVECAEEVTKPGKYYVFSITPKKGGIIASPPWFLSATSELERDEWMQQIALCGDGQDQSDSGSIFEEGDTSHAHQFDDVGAAFLKEQTLSTHCLPNGLDALFEFVKAHFCNRNRNSFSAGMFLKKSGSGRHFP
mmetsp:Transcript_38375/g.46851  ORF Transcript_38375/g.46851 Transcript_38375/m.46851 type:complete len:267 (+) Transcript_38375:183-983(+)|eukprot:CAMPEP_0172482398 /NCGR_PEP_ID=MMETSP1066-20121228/8766_1 /TAXON_ID=671091 /ORGANISM="Coscinodiscus wailesii, Strain CCMP2513" /LENGTH=266 /DNA_ID=CAMNT_0013245463 /DNA_START=162 /DNA_END=962 /DNA_ORIENTATION=+